MTTKDLTKLIARSSLKKVAINVATLESALPQQERLRARMELVEQVKVRQGQSSASRSLYPCDSVVRHEIERIADQFTSILRTAIPAEHATLWRDFSVAVTTQLALIERAAQQAIQKFVAHHEPTFSENYLG